MELNNNQQAFLTLVKAGLWENSQKFRVERLGVRDSVDWEEVYRLAEEQSVVGLVAAGIEYVIDLKVPQEVALTFAGSSLQLEQQNKAMNFFVAKVIDLLRSKDVYALLVKGQGIAQCYDRPLWRTSGDIDLLLSDTNYEKAKKVLLPLSVKVEPEYKTIKHLGMTMKNGLVVELHGTLHSRLSKRVDRGIDAAQNGVFFGGSVRSWQNGSTIVFLPGVDEDVVFIFTHILHHYFIDGIGLRQICDWCRLLWTYRNSLNHELLESRIRKMGLMSEWKAFASLAVDYLGMPAEAMPFYSGDKKWSRKAERMVAFVLEVGNFGHNQKRMYSDSYVWKKTLALWRKFKNFCRHTPVFPMDSLQFFCHFVIDGLDAVSRKE